MFGKRRKVEKSRTRGSFFSRAILKLAWAKSVTDYNQSTTSVHVYNQKAEEDNKPAWCCTSLNPDLVHRSGRPQVL